MICLETPIEDTICFESMRILIESNRLHEVGGHIILHIGNVGYRIMVKEASCSFVINPQFITSAGSSAMEIKTVNEDSRLPIIHGADVASKGEMANNHWSEADRMVDISSDGVFGESPRFETNGESGHCADRTGKSDSINASSCSKTKTAQLSANGYSKELEKIYQRVPSSQFEEVVMPQGSRNHHLTIRNELIFEGPNPNLQCSELSALPDFSNPIVEEGGEASIQLDVEVIKTVEVSLIRKSKAPKRQIAFPGKRVTRSQAKQSKVSVTKSKSIWNRSSLGEGVIDESPLGSEFESTTGSIVKLAKESIEVGKVLGIKVISNEENALKRITKSLKSQRSTRSTHKVN